MTTQEFLTSLIDAIALSFITLMLVDFISRLVTLVKTTAASSKQIAPNEIGKIFDAKPESKQFSLTPDPWLSPIEFEVKQISSPITVTQVQTPLLLLPPSKESVSQLRTDTSSTANKLLANINLDNLQLRLARKIANVLGIPQKANKKDKSVSTLRSQIQEKFKQPDILTRDEVNAVCKLLAIA